MTQKLSLNTFLKNPTIPLDACDTWPKKAIHHFDRQQAIALLAARAIKRPLLIRGEPGCGKTQIARAAAQVLNMPLAKLVVNERTETEDLFWYYDALKRLSDANNPKQGVQSEEVYLSAGPLWWALDHSTAEKYNEHHSSKPDFGKEAQHKRSFDCGVLLLIDEIDKADRSVPNSLLEALGNYSFEVPFIGERIRCNNTQPAPLIVITTNNEQELPPAFVRRCLVLDIVLDDADFVETLANRGEALFGEEFGDSSIYTRVGEQLLTKRNKLRGQGETRLPGQAEYLDHLEAILAMKKFDSEYDEKAVVEELSRLTYEKFDR